MIFFDRGDRPASLEPKNEREFGRVQRVIDDYMSLPEREREQTDVPPVWRERLEEIVFRALMSSNDGNCAFCSVSESREVYRFRPPAYAEPIKKAEGAASYLWLAFDWENLFPICRNCRPEQPAYFPVDGYRAARNSDLKQEKALLFAPGELSERYARPYQHFLMRFSGQIEGLTRRGKIFVDHFRLNQFDTVGKRWDALGDFMETLTGLHHDAAFRDGGPFMAKGGEHRQGFKYLLLARLVEKMMDQVGVEWSRSPYRIDETLRGLLDRDDYRSLLSAAGDTIQHEDAAEDMAGLSESREGVRKRIETDPTYVPRLHSVSLTTYKSLETIGFDLPVVPPTPAQNGMKTQILKSAKTSHAPCLLILGENATGKSSILEGIALTLMPGEMRDALNLKVPRLTLDPAYMGDPGKAPVLRSEIVVQLHPLDELPGQVLRLSIDGEDGAQQPFQFSQTPEGPVPMVFAYGAHRLYGAKKRPSELRHVETLFQNDRHLPDPEVWLRKLKKDDLNEVVSALRHLIQIDGRFDSINVDPRTKKSSITFVKEREGKEYRLTQQLDVVSSGYRAVMALVCDVLEGLASKVGSVRAARETPAVVLIDEIEAHLHPRWKLQIVTGLRRALPQATFIITTHDPLCVRGMFANEIFALNRYQNAKNAGLNLPEMVERVDGFENIESMTIEQLLTSEMFQLFSTDDPALDHAVAEAADDLASTSAVRSQVSEIVDGALPIGRTDLSRLVQEAVFEYLQDRRSRNSTDQKEARMRAKNRIKALLKERMP
ncbi:putative ATP-binding protein involved in virulence (plasmid) [Phaeobacter piscinae]|uniref:ATP-binding protein involved in virulence n=1 Tax=Phaeobacter piscinae TaxID=1580596 RepID=A0ABM6PIU6_9RHOB|nr:AAA family ATPase [Phaeobacter piscinae]ATG37818.1 putative ATP-binding protein involved in virulence [Phaeobacter piscinae]AUQ88339.1 putative ATP-binding protein involved in virulence [Phaeobacter piscinae]AUR26222.1 putative ATP-binding protein involved in virulence [Phaeobacter piscinae]